MASFARFTGANGWGMVAWQWLILISLELPMLCSVTNHTVKQGMLRYSGFPDD